MILNLDYTIIFDFLDFQVHAIIVKNLYSIYTLQ